MSKTCRVLFQKYFEKLVYLVGFYYKNFIIMSITESFVKWRRTKTEEARGATRLRNSAVVFKDGTKRRGHFCSICNLAQKKKKDGAFSTLNV